VTNTDRQYQKDYDRRHQETNDRVYDERDDRGSFRDFAYSPDDRYTDTSNSADSDFHYASQQELINRRNPPAPDRVEEVWLKEKQGRITIHDRDLRHVEKPTLSRNSAKWAGIAAVVAMVLLAGLLAFSTVPDLSPEDIISMQGYAGEQPTKTPFNLASLRDCTDIENCKEAATATITLDNSETASEVKTFTNTQEVILTSSASTNSSGGYIEVDEIPTISTTPNVEFIKDSNPNTLTVLKQWSNVRSSPDINASIVKSLAAGTRVTQLSESGNWIEIVTGKQNNIVGYMHRSTVGRR